MPTNILYLTALPLVHINRPGQYFFHPGTVASFGVVPAQPSVDQVFTLFPDEDFATKFFPDEVDYYMQEFERQARMYLTGGHVSGYEFHKQPTEDDRIIVRVVQHVR
jgi:hypothetical protein